MWATIMPKGNTKIVDPSEPCKSASLSHWMVYVNSFSQPFEALDTVDL